MTTPPSNAAKLELGRPPEAGALSIERLVAKAQDGGLRIPHFQRGLKWKARDVLSLFDSIRKGLPIGSLLFWKRPAPGGTLTLGPLRLEVPGTPEARWVVDGQQRVVALAASLSRGLPLPQLPQDPYIVYFDPTEETFQAPAPTGEVPDEWVPLPYLLDATELSEFVHEWRFGSERRLRTALFEAGTRIRQYEVPVYTVETEDESVLREIFYRINKSGRPLGWEDVHDALYGQESSEQLTTLDDLAGFVSRLGFGELEPPSLTPVILAMRGLDVTRPLGDHLKRDRSALDGAAQQGAEVLPRVVGFLRRSRIPHLRFLPRTFVLESLARFFALHPEPSQRSLTLLTRWLWRVLAGIGSFDERTFRRHAVDHIAENEHASVQALLRQAALLRGTRLDLSGAFDARAARTRLTLLGLALLNPRNLSDAEPIDPVALAGGESGLGSLPRLVPGHRDNANRLLHPPQPHLRALLEQRVRGERLDDNEEILRSHAFSADAVEAYRRGQWERCLELRRSTIQEQVNEMACWDPVDRDRPPIDYLISLDNVT